MAIFQCDLLKNSKNRCIASLRNYFLCFLEGKRTSIMGQVAYFLSLRLYSKIICKQLNCLFPCNTTYFGMKSIIKSKK